MTQDYTEALAKYDVADAAIAAMAERAAGLSIDGLEDKAGLSRVREARIEVRDLRVRVEKTRKELKADALAYGKAVDGEARRIREQLEPIEAGLKEQEDAIASEKAAIALAQREAKEAALQARVDALVAAGAPIQVRVVEAMTDVEYEEALKDAQEAQEVSRKMREQEEAAEAKRQLEQREAEEKERAAREAERAELDEQRAAQRAEADRLTVERLAQEKAIIEEKEALAEEKRKLDAAQAERLRQQKEQEDEGRRLKEEQARQHAAELNRRTITKAKQQYHDEGRIEVHDDAPVSRADNNPDAGAYVQAWVWVADDE